MIMVKESENQLILLDVPLGCGLCRPFVFFLLL